MPCNSDYLEPTHRERELQRAALLLVFVKNKLGISISDELLSSSTDQWCHNDYIPELCSYIKNMTPNQLKTIVYNGRDAMSRALADWWEEHMTADAERIKRERKQKQEKKLVEKAKAKLTEKELQALKKYL